MRNLITCGAAEGIEDMRRRGPDISRLKRVTGFKSAIGINDMPKGVIVDLKDNSGKR